MLPPVESHSRWLCRASSVCCPRNLHKVILFAVYRYRWPAHLEYRYGAQPSISVSPLLPPSLPEDDGVHASNMAATAIDKQPSGTITLLTADGAELKVDKELLCSSSKFFQGMLVACDTGRLHVEETADTLGTVLAVMAGQQAPGTYDVRSTACWSTYKKVLVVADKYDMALVKERCEKLLISRCLRGRMLCSAFRFQDVAEGAEWLAMCQKYDLRDLGWYCAYDLGTQLALGNWARPARELLDGVHCPELLKTLIEAAQATTAAGGAAAGGAPAAREQGAHGAGQGQQGQQGQEQGGAAQAE